MHKLNRICITEEGCFANPRNKGRRVGDLFTSFQTSSRPAQLVKTDIAVLFDWQKTPRRPGDPLLMRQAERDAAGGTQPRATSGSVCDHAAYVSARSVSITSP